jgi:hypothetical protein
MFTIKEYLNKLFSRKFQVLIIAIGLFIIRPTSFTGDHMVIIMSVYMGVNVATKLIDSKTGSPE